MRVHPEITWIMVASSASAYLSVSFVLLLIKHFDATHAELVKALRRILQVRGARHRPAGRQTGWQLRRAALRGARAK